MDKEKIKNDLGLVAGLLGYMGEHMKIDADDLERVITDEEMHVVDMYAELAFALRNLDDAIDALPD